MIHDEIGLDTLQRRILRAAIAACFATPFVLMLVYSGPGTSPPWVATFGVALYAVAVLAILAGSRGTALGGSTLIAGLLAVASGALWVEPLGWIVYFVPLLVVFATVFASLIGSLVVATAVSVVLVVVHQLGGLTGSEQFWIILALTWANVLVAWLAAEPLRLALRWSWSEFQRAEHEAERARRHQGELGQLVKSLNVAQDRLEHVNRELERARQAADEARRLKAEFAATISHELRTPLNLIIGFSEMIAMGAGTGPPLPTTYQRDIDTIYRNARHLSSLIDDILDLSQIDAVRMGILREPASLAELVREAVSVVEPLFQRKGLTLEAHVDPDVPELNVDRTRVRQILINLLNNAARFTDEGGACLSARVEENDIVVAVEDTGIGIPPEDLPFVFEEFRQVTGLLGQRRGGSGLGLTISRRLVELHGGTMWVESKPGEGSRFAFRLPLHENVASIPYRRAWESWASRSASSSAAAPVVVVFDQDAEPAHLLQRHLDGYQVVVASEIGEILDVQQKSTIDALLVTGPTDQEALERAGQVRSRFADLPVFVCSVASRRDLARRLGVVEYLVKPILREQLDRVLRPNGRLVRDVLVVDDDPDMVDLLTRIIQSIGRRIRVRWAYGGAEGMAMLRTRPPGLLILDLLMPEVDGYAILHAMRTEPALREVPVAVVSARSHEEETITAGLLGITRGPGLPAAEFMRLLKVTLDEIHRSPTSIGPTPPVGFPG